MGLIALFRDGGIIMYPLLFCSLIVWAVIFEKVWSLSKFRKEVNRLYAKALEFLKNGKKEEVKFIYANSDELISAPHLALFENAHLAREVRMSKVARRLQETQIGLKRFLWILGTVGSMAPFIGLFGTVSGIIRSFESIAVTGKSGFSVVASGLAEALIATAAGIFVAVVAIIFYNYFQVKVSNLGVELKNKLEDLADLHAGEDEASNKSAQKTLPEKRELSNGITL
ncbi:MAG: MotA/TolQ/ExbB proton channel family protein [Oligoflexia bacterium]|nr:MotA/TolQ/ExbB proton channel family protein [Oligoflexia bacterium]MBF0366063.1 MotA/TolQ/ExbB proton channel family protein [Oligoflexia bacterium]